MLLSYVKMGAFFVLLFSEVGIEKMLIFMKKFNDLGTIFFVNI